MVDGQERAGRRSATLSPPVARLDYHRDPRMAHARSPGILMLLLVTSALAACSRTPPPAAPAPCADPALGRERSASGSPPAAAHAHAHAHDHEPLPRCESESGDPLAAARTWFDDGEFLQALACASQAAAFEPAAPAAHAERAAALAALERFDDAKLAYARLLALAPDHVDGLLGAAHLYAVLLPGAREHDELAALYAERGLRLVTQDVSTRARFALVSAIALNDLGQASRALDRAQLALTLLPEEPEALHERALANFELSRLTQAAADFRRLLDDPVARASANHHLGLILERQGLHEEAEAHLAHARALAPEHFLPPVELSREEFARVVARAVEELPADMRRDLRGIPVASEELPSDADLLGGEPPLSPVILGLYRGPPLGEPCLPQDLAADGHCRSVALYRKNLQRATRTREELLLQVRVTLLHEVGHLRGEDDHELAARGLE